MSERLTVNFRVEPNSILQVAGGRDAWALQALVAAGEGGVTPIGTPGPRWSAYIFNLRQMGLVIETVHESHSGPFPGTHARYVLRSDVSIVDDETVAA